MPFELATGAVLLGAGLVAGMINAVAGGGSFFTFPVFLWAGLPPVVANASNAVAVWPANLMAVSAYRAEIRRHAVGMRTSMIVAVVGGIAGSLLLIAIGNRVFAKLIPFLLLFATLIFAFGRPLSAWLWRHPGAGERGRSPIAMHGVGFAFAVYGGFFGAGLGVMLMAGLLLLGVHEVQINNALKNLFAALVTSFAVAVFAVSGLVSWPHTLVAFAGAIAGGYLGARIARRLAPHWLRRIVIVVGLALSVRYFFEYYG